MALALALALAVAAPPPGAVRPWRSDPTFQAIHARRLYGWEGR